MSDIIKFPSQKSHPFPPGQLERLSQSLVFLPRPTKYQDLCYRIARKALDLPVSEWCLGPEHQGKLLRNLDRLDLTSVDRWILAASEIDELAAMVMLDAIDYFCACLRFLTQSHDHDFGGKEFKAEFTKSIRGTPFVFQIPPGCELTLYAHQRFDEGNYGVGRVARCHLSESFTHENWAHGGFVGNKNGKYSALGYFKVPCSVVPSFKRTPIDVHDERWDAGGVTGYIPYQWIIQAKREDDTGKGSLDAAPSEHQILSLAESTIATVKARFSEIGNK